jgi:Oxysterol-binding protein
MELYTDTKKIILKYAEQELKIKQRKHILENYLSQVNKLKDYSDSLNAELIKTLGNSPSKFEMENSSSEEGDTPEFIPIEKIYYKEILALKHQKKELKKNISQLLRLLGKDPEENEEYSSGEWDEIPKVPKSEVKSDLQVLSPAISLWQPIPSNDDYRVPSAYKSGGIGLTDEKMQNKIRSVGKELVREIGRKLLNGDFNLTRVSVPIRCMQANTALHNTLKTGILLPPYLNYASKLSDPLERFKLVIASSISTFYYLSTFEKPINPVLGETLFGKLEDGSCMYAEQSSHHPPISHFLIENSNYRLTGYFSFSAKAGLNSVTVVNHGKKLYQFPDGHSITQTCGEDSFGGTFFGTLRHECLGSYIFTDLTYGNTCTIIIGLKNKPSDYLEGNICDKNGKVLSKATGTWIGYLDFDKVRYWDVRHIKPYDINYAPNLPSDSENRKDLQLLRQGDVDQAQQAKEDIENLQRHDRKLREKLHPH